MSQLVQLSFTYRKKWKITKLTQYSRTYFLKPSGHWICLEPLTNLWPASSFLITKLLPSKQRQYSVTPLWFAKYCIPLCLHMWGRIQAGNTASQIKHLISLCPSKNLYVKIIPTYYMITEILNCRGRNLYLEAFFLFTSIWCCCFKKNIQYTSSLQKWKCY